MLMALLLYGRELRQARRARRRQLEEQTKAQEQAALRSSSCGLLCTGSDSGADSGASFGRLPTELQAKVDTRRRHHRENSLRIMLNRPQVWRRLSIPASYPYTTMAVLATAILSTAILTKVWTLNIWVWLLLYPSVTRKALQTFDCIELLGVTYLRADPAIQCSGDDWWFMAVLASVGVFVTCIVAPIALVRQTSRKHASSERVQRSRVALLTNTYRDKYHYWEAVDLTRKLLLTSVVLLVGPDSVLQLWFVTTTGLVFLVLFLALSPHRDEAAGRIQLAALVQLEFTYVTAALFFDRPPKAPQGEVLVLCNSLVALVMVGVAMRGIGVLGVELRELQLTFTDNRTVVQLPPLRDGLATDVYISREHANAQEQSSVIKGLIVTMLPTCKVYLNEDDDDDDGDVEDLVHEASTFMAVLTTQYLCSRKCMLGLLVSHTRPLAKPP